MRHKTKRVLSVALALVMSLSSVPTSAFAAETEPETEAATEFVVEAEPAAEETQEEAEISVEPAADAEPAEPAAEEAQEEPVLSKDDAEESKASGDEAVLSKEDKISEEPASSEETPSTGNGGTDIVLSEKASNDDDLKKVNIKAEAGEDTTAYLFFWQYDGSLPSDADAWSAYFVNPFDGFELKGYDKEFDEILLPTSDGYAEAKLGTKYEDGREVLSYLSFDMAAGTSMDADIEISLKEDVNDDDVYVMIEAAYDKDGTYDTTDYLPVAWTAEKEAATAESVTEETEEAVPFDDDEDEFFFEEETEEFDEEFAEFVEENETEDETENEAEDASITVAYSEGGYVNASYVDEDGETVEFSEFDDIALTTGTKLSVPDESIVDFSVEADEGVYISKVFVSYEDGTVVEDYLDMDDQDAEIDSESEDDSEPVAELDEETEADAEELIAEIEAAEDESEIETEESANEDHLTSYEFSVTADADNPAYVTVYFSEMDGYVYYVEDPDSLEIETYSAEDIMTLGFSGTFSVTRGGRAVLPRAMTRSGTWAQTFTRTVTFTDTDGSEVTASCYCIQPAYYDDDGVEYGEDYDIGEASKIGTGSDRNILMNKAYYYMYGGPMWGKDITSEDGSTTFNLRDYINDSGLGFDKDGSVRTDVEISNDSDSIHTQSRQYYCLTHYVLGYIWTEDNEDIWNVSNNHHDSTGEVESVTNLMSSDGKALIKNIVSIIDQLPLPDASLSKTSLSADSLQSDDTYKSDSAKYKSIDENYASVSLPTGITLVDTTTGTTYTGGSTATVYGGDSFYFIVDPSVATGTLSSDGKTMSRTITFTTRYATDFQAYVFKFKGQQDMGFAWYGDDKDLTLTLSWPAYAYLEVIKSSANTSVTSDNSAYSLAGAVFTIKNSSGSTAATLTTKSDGTTDLAELTPGTYTIQETTAPAGYELDSTTHTVNLTAGYTKTSPYEYKVSDTPITYDFDIMVEKSTPYDTTMTLAGGVFKVEFYAGATSAGGSATRTWYFETQEDDDGYGIIRLLDRYLADGYPNDSLYYASDGTTCIPLGTIVITEEAAPEGYLTWDESNTIVFTENSYSINGTSHSNSDRVSMTVPQSAMDTVIVEELPHFGGLDLYKIDSEMIDGTQGTATLAGATFEIVSENDYTVCLQPDQDVFYEKGDVVMTITTDENGYATTGSNMLQYGKYSIREVESSYGYWLDDSFSGVVYIHDDKTVVSLGEDAGYGESHTGDWEEWDGYFVNEDGEDFDDATVDYQIDKVNQIARRSDLAFEKVDIDGTHFPYIPFMLTAYDDDGNILEQHVIVSDANGWVSTASMSYNSNTKKYDECRPHSNNTNGFDKYVSGDKVTAEGQAVLDKMNDALESGTTLSDDEDASTWGVWFQGGQDCEGTPNDDYGALYTAYYRITEIQCDANADREENLLWSDLLLIENTTGEYTDAIDDNADMHQYDPFVNTEIYLSSSAKDVNSETQVVAESNAVEVEDTVTYEHVSSDKTYRMETKFVDITAGNENVPITGTNDSGASVKTDDFGDMWVTKEFQPLKTSGTTTTHGNITMNALIDTTGRRGHTIVAVDYLYEYVPYSDSTGAWLRVARHEDYEDAAQYLYVPDIHTWASDILSGDRIGVKSTEDGINDHVTYMNLAARQEYILIMTVRDADTGEIIPMPDGSTYVQKAFRQATTSAKTPISGEVEMPIYYIDSSAYGDRTLAVTEYLFLADDNNEPMGDPLLKHDTLDDEDETIRFIEVDTAAKDGETGDIVGTVENPATNYDEVTITNMVFDMNDHEDGSNYYYTVRGHLVYQQDFVDENGVSHKAGETVPTLDGTQDEVIITCDADGNISFTYTDGTPAEGSVISLEYGKNVKKYVDDNDDASNNYVSDANSIVATVTVEMIYKVDAELLQGTTTVAYEYLYHDSVNTESELEVARHEDITDPVQSVHYPKVITYAADTATDSVVGGVRENATLVDTVEMENLVPGMSYIISGVLVDQSTGKPIEIGGKTVTADVDVLVTEDGKITTTNGSNAVTTAYDEVMNQVDGSVDITFNYDASGLEDTTLVVYVDLIHNGATVYNHETLLDLDESVFYPMIRSNAWDGDTMDHVGTVEGGDYLYDTVYLRNLRIGEEYTVYGVLYDKLTGDPILDVDGSLMTESCTFIAGETSALAQDHGSADGEVLDEEYNVEITITERDDERGYVNCEFVLAIPVDSTGLEGVTAVIIETLSYKGTDMTNDYEYAMSTEYETLHYPELVTAASISYVPDAQGYASEITMTDTAYLYNLVIGEEYAINGILMNKDTGEPIHDMDGNEITQTATFTVTEEGLVPENGETVTLLNYDEDNQSVDAAIKIVYNYVPGLDTLAAVVVFEELTHNGIMVDQHDDIDDYDQTDAVPLPPEKAVDIPEDDDGLFNNDHDEVAVEDVLTYEIRYFNHNGYPATVTITDTLDPGLDFVLAYNGGEYDEDTRTITWVIEDAPAYSWSSVTFEARVNEEAKVMEEGVDIAAVDNQADVKIEVPNHPEIEVVEHPTNEVENPVENDEPTAPLKGVDTPIDDNGLHDNNHAEVLLEDELEYEVWFYNNYNRYATVTVTDVLDIGLNFVSASDDGTYDEDTRTITWVVEDVPAFTWYGVTFKATVNEEALVIEEGADIAAVNNIADVVIDPNYDPDDPDDPWNDYNGEPWNPIPENPEELQTNEVENPIVNDEPTAPIKGVDTPIDDDGLYNNNHAEVEVDDAVGYKIWFYNNYDRFATVTITDVLDPGLDFVSASDGGTYDEETRTITWVIEDVMSFTWSSVTFEATVNETALTIEEGKDIAAVNNMANVVIDPNYNPDDPDDPWNDPDGNPWNPVPENPEDMDTNEVENPLLNDEPTAPLKGVDTPIDDDGLHNNNHAEVLLEDELEYQVWFYNNYDRFATVTITDVLDPGLDFVSASDGGTYDEETRTITWVIENVMSFSWNSVTFKATVNEEALVIEEGAGIAAVNNIANVVIDPNYSPEDPDDPWNDDEGEPYNPVPDYPEDMDTNEVENPIKNDEPTAPIKGVDTPIDDNGLYDNDGAEVLLNDELEYEVRFYNNYNRRATITVTDVLDPGLDFVSASDSGSYDPNTRTITWVLEDAEPFTWYAVTFRATVNEEALVIEEGRDIAAVNNIANVVIDPNYDPDNPDDPWNDPDGNPYNPVPENPEDMDTNEVENPIQPDEPTAPEKGVDTPIDNDGLYNNDGAEVNVGDTLEYEVRFYNHNNRRATVTVTDVLDEGLDFKSASDNGSYDKKTRTITWVIEDVDPFTWGSVTFKASVNETALVIEDGRTVASVENEADVKIEVPDHPEIDIVEMPTNKVENPIPEPPAEPGTPTTGTPIVKTGDDFNGLGLIVSLAMIAALGLTGCGLSERKKKHAGEGQKE